MTLLDTPVAVVDLDRLERSLERLQAHCDRVGLQTARTYAVHDRATVAAAAPTLDASRCMFWQLGQQALLRIVPSPTRAPDPSSDPGPAPGFDTVIETPRSTIERLSEEHAIVALGPGRDIELGHQVRIVSSHACLMANLADELVALREGDEPRALRVDARGRSR